MSRSWLTSDDIIEDVKRTISFPTSQNTFDDEDILAFANKEMAIAIVPDLMTVHEEYFVTKLIVPLEDNKSRYLIPERAVGMKLRDLFLVDAQGNLGEMTRINPDDKSYFGQSTMASNNLYRFYLENNEVVLSPGITSAGGNSLQFEYFQRPNQLVKDEKAATIDYFTKTITVDNTTLIAGDTITIGSTVFTAVSGSPATNEFQIGVTSIITATNLNGAINTNATYFADISSNVVTVHSDILSTAYSTTNSAALQIQVKVGISFISIPANIVDGVYIDFLQTKPGHKIRGISVKLTPGSVSGNHINLNISDIPEDLIIGDYVCEEYECIIPGIPSDLHHMLVERTAGRILSAIGDQAGLQAQNMKIAEITSKQQVMLDNRVEGAPPKVFPRNSPLRNNRRGYKRGY
jgi:hypothetical protein